MTIDTQPQRMKLVIDGYNTLCAMQNVLPYGVPVNTVGLDLGRLGDVIAAKANRPTECTNVAIHLGVADAQRDPYRYGKEMEQNRRWRRDKRVTVRGRTSRYNPDTRQYTEKGVDVAVGMDLLTAQASGNYDTVVVFSADRDLEPALEQAYDAYRSRKVSTRVELARWTGQHGLWLHGSKLWCHYLDENDLRVCSTRRGNRHAA